MDEQLETSSKAIAPKLKKPYVKPAFRYEKVFTTQALSCGKVVGSQGQCLQAARTS